MMQNKVAWWALKSINTFLKITCSQKKETIAFPNKILICQPAHLGDVILTTSLFAPLKKIYPKIKIGIVVSSLSKQVVEKHPLLDWIHVVDHWKLNRSSKSKFLQYYKTARTALREIENVGYDVSIDCPFHFPNLASLCFQANIPTRVGFATAGFSSLLTHQVPFSFQPKSVASHFFSLLGILPEMKNVSCSLKPSLHIDTSWVSPYPLKQYIVIHMGAGNSMKKWPHNKWKELCTHLSKKELLLFTGRGMEEKKEILSIAKNNPNMIDLSDQLNWNQLLTIVKGAKAVIGVDTSVGHAAAAFDTPSYLVYTNIYPHELWKPLSEKATLFSHKMPCAPCYNGRGCATMNCIRDVEVSDILNKLPF